MNWYQMLYEVPPEVLPHVAVDAFRNPQGDGLGVSISEFMGSVSQIVSSRGFDVGTQLRCLLPLAYELTDGNWGFIKNFLGPLLRRVVDCEELDDTTRKYLLTFGLHVRTESEMDSSSDVRSEPTADPVDSLQFIAVGSEKARPRVVILTALDEEFDAFSKYANDSEIRVGDPADRIFRELGRPDVVLLRASGMGNVSSALATQWAIQKWAPGLIVLAGIAGGFTRSDEELALGDIIIPPQVIGYELAKIKNGRVGRRLRIASTGSRALNLAEGVARDATWLNRLEDEVYPGGRQPAAHFRNLASGDKVVADGAFVANVRRLWPGIIATEMEGIGLALASFDSVHQPQVLIAKSLCDWSNGDKNDKYHGLASRVSAAFTVELAFNWADKYPPSEKAPEPRQIRLNGSVKNSFWDRLEGVDAERLANALGIEKRYRRTWKPGFEAMHIWEWAEERGRLGELPSDLVEIGRVDLSLLFYATDDILGNKDPIE